MIRLKTYYIGLTLVLTLAIVVCAGCQLPGTTKPPAGSTTFPPATTLQPATTTSTSGVVTPAPAQTRPVTPPATTTQPVSSKPVEPTKTQSSIDYPVPFTSQAPFADWDAVHGEACEEASMVMVARYFAHQSISSPHDADQAILGLIDWETQNGYGVDVTADDAATILRRYYSLTVDVISPATPEAIRAQLSAGHLVIIPAAGRLLKNPNFQTPGPIYHMLVIRGYTGIGFITNDPGTRRGEKYFYPTQQLINAIHDWDYDRARDGMTDEEIAQGRSVFLAIRPSS